MEFCFKKSCKPNVIPITLHRHSPVPIIFLTMKPWMNIESARKVYASILLKKVYALSTHSYLQLTGSAQVISPSLSQEGNRLQPESSLIMHMCIKGHLAVLRNASVRRAFTGSHHRFNLWNMLYDLALVINLCAVNTKKTYCIQGGSVIS